MKATYIQRAGDDLLVANAARVSMDKQSDWDDGPYAENLLTGEKSCYGPMPGKLKEKDVKLINYLAKHQHYTPFEHCTVTLHLKVPLFVRSQIHRHRTFAYNEISRRYVKDNLEFYWPDKWRKAAENVKQGSSDDTTDTYFSRAYVGNIDEDTRRIVGEVYDLYWALTNSGVCAEQARMILPQNLYTSFYMTGNLRNWAHFLKLRLDPHAQKEVQIIASMCAEIIEPLFPVSYGALMSDG